MDVDMGLHIGQGQNPTALAVVGKDGNNFSVFLLERFPLGTPYSDVAARLSQVKVFCEKNHKGNLKMVRVDVAGVGSPVIDLVLGETIKREYLEAVYFTGGLIAERNEHGLMVPKDLMISRLKILAQINCLKFKDTTAKFPGTISIGKLINKLQEDLRKYETRLNPDPLSWSPETSLNGEYDDLLVALSLACWPSASNSSSFLSRLGSKS